MSSNSSPSTASRMSTSVSKTGGATAATVSPSSLRDSAQECFSANQNCFQCRAKTPKKPGLPHDANKISMKVKNDWYSKCCNVDLDLDECAKSSSFDDNCESDGDYFLNYVNGPNETTSSSTSSSTLSSTSTNTQSAVPSDKSMSAGAIAGAVVGSVLGAAFLAILAAALLWRKRRARQELSEKETGKTSREGPVAGIGEPWNTSTAGFSSAIEPQEMPSANEQHELPNNPSLSGEGVTTTSTEPPANTTSNTPAHPSTHPEPS